MVPVAVPSAASAEALAEVDSVEAPAVEASVEAQAVVASAVEASAVDPAVVSEAVAAAVSEEVRNGTKCKLFSKLIFK